MKGNRMVVSSVFKSAMNGHYYFWLGNDLSVPFEDFNEAHAAMTQLIEEAHGKEETSQESD